MFNPNQAFLLVQKVEIGPKGLEKKKDTIEFEKPILQPTPIGANVLAFYQEVGTKQQAKSGLKVGLKVSVKVGGPYYTLT